MGRQCGDGRALGFRFNVWLPRSLSLGDLPLIPGWLVMNVCYGELTLQGFPGLSGAPENRAEAQPCSQRNQEPGGQADRHPPPRVHVRPPIDGTSHFKQ